MDLKIDPEFEGLIPAQSDEEHQALIDSLNRDKFDKAFPIVTWKGIIIDGHNRYHICKELGIEFETVEKDFETHDDVLMWIIDRQIERRNLTREQRAYLIGERYNREKNSTSGRPKIVQNEPISAEISAGSTSDKIGRDANESGSTVKRESKYAVAFNQVGANTGIKPMRILSNGVKITQKDMIDLSKMDKLQQNKVMEKVKNKEVKNIKEAIKDVKPPEPKQPERNEQGVLIALPKKVTMRMVEIKPEHMFQNEDDESMWLQCDINVDGTRRECYVFPLENEDNFMFVLPNVKNLVIDFNEIFKTMTPIVSYLPREDEHLKFTRSFSHEEWNDFVASRFPDMIIDEPDIKQEPQTTNDTTLQATTEIEPQEPVKPEEPEEPENSTIHEKMSVSEKILALLPMTYDKLKYVVSEEYGASISLIDDWLDVGLIELKGDLYTRVVKVSEKPEPEITVQAEDTIYDEIDGKSVLRFVAGDYNGWCESVKTDDENNDLVIVHLDVKCKLDVTALFGTIRKHGDIVNPEYTEHGIYTFLQNAKVVDAAFKCIKERPVLIGCSLRDKGAKDIEEEKKPVKEPVKKQVKEKIAKGKQKQEPVKEPKIKEPLQEPVKPETKEEPNPKELDELSQTILKILREVGDLQLRPLIEQICKRNHEKVPEEKKAYRALEMRVRRRCDDLRDDSVIEYKKVGKNTFFSVNLSLVNKVDNGVKVSGE